jgi:excisionase family DNA binding protein
MESHQRVGKAVAAPPPPAHNFGQHPPSPWLTAVEAARYVQVKHRTLSLWARQGKVKSYPLSGTTRKIRRFLVSDLDDMLGLPSVALHTKGVQ